MKSFLMRGSIASIVAGGLVASAAMALDRSAAPHAPPPVRPAVVTLINALASKGSGLSSFGLSLDSLSASELRFVRNTLVARHGYRFTDPSLQQFFSAFPWYRPRDKVTLPAADQLLAACIARVEDGKKPVVMTSPLVRIVGADVELYSNGDIRWGANKLVITPSGSVAEAFSPDCLGEWRDPAYRTALLQPSKPHVEAQQFDTRDGPVLIIGYQGNLGDEDPPTEYQVVYTGRTGKVDRLTLYGAPHRPPRIASDGTITQQITTCDGDRGVTIEYTERHTRDANGRYRSGGRQNVKVVSNYCAACPFVFARVGSDLVEQGEILRHLASPEQEASRQLTIAEAASGDGLVRIELRELKDEITYLDDIALEVDGQVVRPIECTASAMFCQADGRHYVLRKGDSLRLSFRVSEHRWRLTRLRARGYYVPVPRHLSGVRGRSK